MKKSLMIYTGLGIMGAVLLSGCDMNFLKKKDAGAHAGPAKAAPVAMPLTDVGVVRMKEQVIPIISELPGRTTPYRIAEVRPQVGGIILRRMFEEGSDVKAGQQLYQIDARVYQADFESAEAGVSRAKATLIQARLLAQRYRPLVKIRAVSQQEYDDAVAALKKAEADFASAKAALEQARIQLVYTKVLSPISGRIGRSMVTEGALVTANQPQELAVVQQLDPIYVDVTQSSVELLRLRKEFEKGNLKRVGVGRVEARLSLEDGSEYPETGWLEFSEVTIDESTGSVTMRAVFPNAKKILLPGMFVHAKIEEGVSEKAVLVPQQGVSRNFKGEATALVVGEGSKVEQRVLNTKRVMDGCWLVEEGLKEGDLVIVEGLQRISPEMEVRVDDMTEQFQKGAEK